MLISKVNATAAPGCRLAPKLQFYSQSQPLMLMLASEPNRTETRSHDGSRSAFPVLATENFAIIVKQVKEAPPFSTQIPSIRSLLVRDVIRHMEMA